MSPSGWILLSAALLTPPFSTFQAPQAAPTPTSPWGPVTELENDDVTVVRVKIAPRSKGTTHTHPTSYLAVYLTDAHLKVTYADGKTEEVHQKLGQTRWNVGPITHADTNLTDQPVEIVLVMARKK